MKKGYPGQSIMQGPWRDTINEGPDPIGNEQEGGGVGTGETGSEE